MASVGNLQPMPPFDLKMNVSAVAQANFCHKNHQINLGESNGGSNVPEAS
jgi:hypothetical protein